MRRASLPCCASLHTQKVTRSGWEGGGGFQRKAHEQIHRFNCAFNFHTDRENQVVRAAVKITALEGPTGQGGADVSMNTYLKIPECFLPL